MDYRCQYCGRKLDSGLRCEVCDAKRSVCEVKTMTTPTKEQIEKIAKVIFITQKDEPVTDLQYDGLSDYWDRYLRKETKSRYRARAKIAIETWEKIRNSPK